MIYNMDCIEGSKRFIADESVDLVVTDPPYNLGFGGTTQTRTKKPRFNIIANDKLSRSDYQRFTFQWLYQAYRILKPGRHIYVCIDWRMYPFMVLWMRRVGFVVKNCIVWDKMRMGVGWQYRFQHEFIIFAVKGESNARKIRTRSAPDIWRIPKVPGNKTVHPTEKPADLMENIIKNSSSEGELVVDFFLGSGPVAEAVILNNRELLGFEIDPVHYETTKNRILGLEERGL
ncbi:DNA-methyltransferase [Paenibacillus naphthalenovorans]|uniref:DNA-methyltransferase n=1 Tax=Paenibacillus naphthalenovorans TaxID=162209 RepID=UPI0008871CF2|nr:site-specific DNA-methyltransferase [Paenibacillus naphthalenovorans]SDI48639.1 site-specific DNA-methyltransferase (adenine-specific) [Paenibacillus naphthalenovorans]